MGKVVRKIYDVADNWIGVETTEIITIEELQIRYPGTLAKMEKDEPFKDHQ